MSAEDAARRLLLGMVQQTEAAMLLDHPGPFVVVETTSHTVIGPFGTLPAAVEGMEAWRPELECDGEPSAQLRVEPLYTPVGCEAPA